MIEAVLWDFGGVITESPFDAFNRYEREHGIPVDFIRGLNAINPSGNAWARFESNAITAAEFDAAFAEESAAAGHRIRGADVAALLSGAVRPRMVAAVEHCKEHFRIGCITNNARWGQGPAMTTDAGRAAEVDRVMALFEVVIESSREGIRKPDPAIYRLACDRLGVDPTRTVYLDDLGINLKPARAMGMTTIKVVSEAQALDDLERTLGVGIVDRSHDSR